MRALLEPFAWFIYIALCAVWVLSFFGFAATLVVFLSMREPVLLVPLFMTVITFAVSKAAAKVVAGWMIR